MPCWLEPITYEQLFCLSLFKIRPMISNTILKTLVFFFRIPPPPPKKKGHGPSKNTGIYPSHKSTLYNLLSRLSYWF